MECTHFSIKALQFCQKIINLNWIVGCKNSCVLDNLIIAKRNVLLKLVFDLNRNARDDLVD